MVNYNTKELTRNCLKSVFEQTKDITFEVIVSDNGSKDGSIDMITKEFPQVILIENNANLGFGAANNRGLKIAKGKYVFYLNSDTVLLNNAVKLFFDHWENAKNKDDIGALEGVLLDEKGNNVLSGSTFPTTKSQFILCFKSFMYSSFLFKLFYSKMVLRFKKNKDEISTGAIDFVCGADLFMLNNENAKYDEDFFMYFEETNMQYQLSKLGKRNFLIDAPKIIHYGGASNPNTSYTYDFYKTTNIYFWESCLIYLKKNEMKYKSLYRFLCFIYLFIYCVLETLLNINLQEKDLER